MDNANFNDISLDRPGYRGESIEPPRHRRWIRIPLQPLQRTKRADPELSGVMLLLFSIGSHNEKGTSHDVFLQPSPN